MICDCGLEYKVECPECKAFRIEAAKEKTRIRIRQWVADHPEKMREARKRWNEKHKDKHKEYYRRYAEKHREEINARARELYRKKNPIVKRRRLE